MKLAQASAAARVTAHIVAVAFCEVWVLKYEIPESLLSEKRQQFASELSQFSCRKLRITNVYTSLCHPKTNGKVERYNRTLATMLQNYVNGHHDDWDEYALALTYA